MPLNASRHFHALATKMLIINQQMLITASILCAEFLQKMLNFNCTEIEHSIDLHLSPMESSRLEENTSFKPKKPTQKTNPYDL
jgi:hypothetical protein